ncbi:hypothetical protein Ciccas_002321 [Cichlidogyrus casuarinus]|uniref:Transporter n=1 Tax=Cichlidogyrus casuarinus TaxID=1844966 RepID=A0ABD2QHK7_9PLAT
MDADAKAAPRGLELATMIQHLDNKPKTESNSFPVNEIEDDNAQTAAEKRGAWVSKMDFLMSTIGFAVDLSNVFRFPYLCYRNGGGAFLIPYFIMLFLCALPMFLMELLIGQHFQQGCIGVWDLCPLLKGIGWTSCILNFLVAMYYNVIIAWSAFYVFSSMSKTIPWSTCDNWWNTARCISVKQNPVNATSAVEFFHRRMLHDHESKGLDDIGTIHWEISLSLLFTYAVLYLCLFKGVKSLGRAAWITSILPYLVLTIMLVRGLMLENSTVGIKYFLYPNFSMLRDVKVWAEAVSQIFFSMGIGFGVHIAYASYNSFHQPIYRSCLIAISVNSFTSLFSGFVVFAYLGYLSGGNDINKISDDMLAELPLPQLWSLLFFIMVFSLGIDSSFGALEALLTALRDTLSVYLKKVKYDREILTAVILIILYLVSLPHACSGGLYVTQFLDQNVANASLLLIGIEQCLVIAWIFGVHSLSDCAKRMFGAPAPLIFCIVLKYITPLLLLFAIFSRLADISVTTMKLSGLNYTYPSWSEVSFHSSNKTLIAFVIHK